jgi:hypothetical protein
MKQKYWDFPVLYSMLKKLVFIPFIRDTQHNDIQNNGRHAVRIMMPSTIIKM